MGREIYKHDPRAMRKNFNPDDYVTVFVDASYDSNTGAAGWAGWCKYGSLGKTIRAANSFYANNSTMAEAYGIEEMIRTIILKDVPLENKRVTITCDCMAAMKGANISALEYFTEHIKFKHVKAHTKSDDARSWVNRWCDKAARNQMQKLRAS